MVMFEKLVSAITGITNEAELTMLCSSLRRDEPGIDKLPKHGLEDRVCEYMYGPRAINCRRKAS